MLPRSASPRRVVTFLGWCMSGYGAGYGMAMAQATAWLWHRLRHGYDAGYGVGSLSMRTFGVDST